MGATPINPRQNRHVLLFDGKWYTHEEFEFTASSSSKGAQSVDFPELVMVSKQLLIVLNQFFISWGSRLRRMEARIAVAIPTISKGNCSAVV